MVYDRSSRDTSGLAKRPRTWLDSFRIAFTGPFALTSSATHRPRIGIFGGSFDPIHLGHLWIAEACREQCRLDQILFIPAATSPLKPHGPQAANDKRLLMLQLAISGHPNFLADSRELDRQGTSYTIDTVRSLQQERPDVDWFLIMGTDAANSLDQWKSPAELLALVTLIIVRRAGEGEINWSLLERLGGTEAVLRSQNHQVTSALIELSSGELRERVKQGRSIRYRVPRSVEAFIEAEKLYKTNA